MALIGHEGRLVMIRRKADPLAGYWAPPAGYVESGESVPEAVIREAREETGLEIALDGLHEVYSRADVNVLIVAYRARIVSGSPVAGDDATEIGLFAAGRTAAGSAAYERRGNRRVALRRHPRRNGAVAPRRKYPWGAPGLTFRRTEP